MLPAGSGTLLIPLDDINEVSLGSPRIENGMTVQDELPPVDLTSIDGVLLSIGRTNSDPADLVTGVEFSISRIAFIPEPASIGSCLLACLIIGAVSRPRPQND